LTTLNAVADVSSRAERPNAAAAVCASEPTATPTADSTPAARPWLMLRVTM
jgi:hypothetical protein